MARLYVANCTGQNLIVNYRLDFTVDDMGRRTSERLVPYKSITIPARQQMPFGGDLHVTQIQEIITQLTAAWGAVDMSEIKTAKARGPIKLIWSIDRPVTLPVLKDVVLHNMEELSDIGAERRRKLALAADDQLTRLVEHELPKMELEFEQVEEDEHAPGRLEEGLRINRRPPTAEAPKRRSRSRAAA